MSRKAATNFLLNISLTVVSCLFVAPFTFAQEQELWQKDWLKFGEAIAPYARAGVIERRIDFGEFNRIFSKEVEWIGTLSAFHFNGVANELSLEMQPIRVSMSDGRVMEIKKLKIWCDTAQRDCKDWSAELIGRDVIFRTELINRTRGYQPVVRLNSQELLIETYGAGLIKVLPK